MPLALHDPVPSSPILISDSPTAVWDCAQLELLQKHLACLIHTVRNNLRPTKICDPSPNAWSDLLPPLRPPDPTLSISNPLRNLFADQLAQLLSLQSPSFAQVSQQAANRNWLDLFPYSKPISPSDYPPSSIIEGQLTMKIPSSMIEPSKNSFSNAAIGRFFGRRPIVEWLTHHANST